MSRARGLVFFASLGLAWPASAWAQNVEAPAEEHAPSTPPAPTATSLGTPSAPSVPGAVAVVPLSADKADKHSFEFGSYGRVHFANDLRGHTGRNSNIVAHGTRISEEDYVELELRREDRFWWRGKALDTRIVSTLALFGPYFHQTAKIPDQLAVRQVYVQTRLDERLTIWGGSRMYRGDDIYLLNWWPLDNQNTIGAGVGYRWLSDPVPDDPSPPREELSVALHVGQQRLENPFQTQTVPVVAPFGFGATNVAKLDRPRTIETLKATYLRRLDSSAGFKVVGYGEAHQIGSGVFKDPLNNQEREIPSDAGWLAGTQLTYFTGVRDTYVSLVLRHARGMAAYDPLAVPNTFANDRTTSGSSETTIALGANYENGPFGLLVGGYMRFFRDGDASLTSTQKYDEGTIVVRPQAFIMEKLGVAVEGSYQARRMAVLQPGTDDQLTAGVTRLALMPFFAPTGPGSYKRPMMYGIYSISFRNAGARALYPAEDRFNMRASDHYLGLGVEWWFNSSSYP